MKNTDKPVASNDARNLAIDFLKQIIVLSSGGAVLMSTILLECIKNPAVAKITWPAILGLIAFLSNLAFATLAMSKRMEFEADLKGIKVFIKEFTLYECCKFMWCMFSLGLLFIVLSFAFAIR